MKKYRLLEAGERTLLGDEFLHTTGGEWKKMEPDYMVTSHDEGYVRRSVPLAGETRFLITLSVTVSVEFDVTGMTEEQIDDIAAETAIRTIMHDPGQQIITDNIDWGKCRVDDEEFQPRCQILEVGEMVKNGDLFLRKSGKWEAVKAEMPAHRVLEFEAGRFKRRIP